MNKEFPTLHMRQQYAFGNCCLAYDQFHEPNNSGKRQGDELAVSSAATRQVVSANCSESMYEQFGILPRFSLPYLHKLPTGRKTGDKGVLPQSHGHVVAAQFVNFVRNSSFTAQRSIAWNKEQGMKQMSTKLWRIVSKSTCNQRRSNRCS